MRPVRKLKPILPGPAKVAVRIHCFLVLSSAALIACASAGTSGGERPNNTSIRPTVRVATYNVSLYRQRHGQLQDDLQRGNPRGRAIAEVVQRVRPDILLLNEFDYAADGKAAELFRTQYLGKSQAGLRPIDYLYSYLAPVNTGVASNLDFDNDGRKDGPGDALGFGRFPGQYGMYVLSRFPIGRDDVRTFQTFLWSDMPGGKLPIHPKTGESYYPDEVLKVFRLSSKSHWDVPIHVSVDGQKQVLHMLCAHPTPPVFDGAENRNGLRNHDEIRLWADYVTPGKHAYLVDDRGGRGGLVGSESFVVLGDLNADPRDGAAAGANIAQLLDHPNVNATFAPASDGGHHASQERPDLNATHQGDPRHDTADFSGDGHGNLRVDYVLPSRDLRVVDSGVFWPKPGEPGSNAVRATDHRMVYVDLALPSADSPASDSHNE